MRNLIPFFCSKFTFNLPNPTTVVIIKMDDIFEIINFVDFIREDEDVISKRYIRDHENPMEFFTSGQFYKRYRYVLPSINRYLKLQLPNCIIHFFKNTYQV